MPDKLRPACKKPGCPGRSIDGGLYCTKHNTKKPKPAGEKDTRPSAGARGYGALWRRLRSVKLAQDPLCEMCLAKGEVNPGTIDAPLEVDHIVPKAQGGEDAIENLQTLCKSHHSRKTAKENELWKRK